MVAPHGPLIVPQGQIVDFIDGKLRRQTPEEYVRQEIEKSLVREYTYDPANMAVEFSVKLGTARKRADVVIFPDGDRNAQERVWAIIECKAPSIPPNHRTEGVEQLKSYMAACANSEFGMWTNGQERHCLRKSADSGRIEFVEITDIPVRGRSLDEAERPSLDSLRPATSDALLFTFKRCHNYIAGNQGLQKPEAFWELLKLIFCKIEDERSSEIHFYALSKERHSLNGQLKVKARTDALFEKVKAKFSSIFKTNDCIELEPRVLAYIVAQLQPWYLLDSDVDVKGKAYEEIVGSNLRGDRGEFFTPRNICRMAVEMLDPGPDDEIMDPACGTGGFVTTAMNHVIEKLRASAMQRWRDPEHPTPREYEELFRRIQEYANNRLIGVDINPNLVKAAKMNMVLNNDGSGGLYQANSLVPPAKWSVELQARQLFGHVDMIVTNPPFGSKIPIDDPAILEQFDLAHVWDYDEDEDAFALREPKQLQKSQPPEILFLERCVQLLTPGTGMLAIVLPDGILGSPGLGYVRDWILRHTRVLASIDLHPDAFQPGNSTQTSVLILQRKNAEQIAAESAAGRINDYDLFMALADHVGHDKRGNTTYVRDEEGNEIVSVVTEKVVEVRDGTPAYKAVETLRKIVDDNTGEIARAYREWAQDL